MKLYPGMKDRSINIYEIEDFFSAQFLYDDKLFVSAAQDNMAFRIYELQYDNNLLVELKEIGYHTGFRKDPRGIINNIEHPYIDKEGIMWANDGGGVTSEGVITLNLRALNQFKKITNRKEDPESLPMNNISVIHKDYKGNFWFGALGGGRSHKGCLLFSDGNLCKFKIVQFRDDQYEHGLEVVYFHFYEDREHNLWFWHNRSINVIHLPDYYAGKHYRDFHYQFTEKNFNVSEADLERFITTDLFLDKNDRLWVMGSKRYDDPGKNTKELFYYELKDKGITSLQEFSRIRFNSYNGYKTPSDSIFFGRQKNQDYGWLSKPEFYHHERDWIYLLSTDGLVRIDPGNLDYVVYDFSEIKDIENTYRSTKTILS